MKIIIVGCGKVGRALVGTLSSDGHDIVAIDTDPSVAAEINNIYDVICVCGSGTDCDTLSEAGVERADLFVSVTGSDEFNMLACFLAKRMGAGHTFARIRNPEYNDKGLGFMKQQLDISVTVNPEMLSAKELANILKFPSAVNVETFSVRSFEMIELIMREGSPLDGMSLADIRKKYTGKYLVCAVRRGDDVFIPDGSFYLKSGDRIGITAAPNEAQKLFKRIGILKKQARNIMILGGSTTAFYLAKMLLAGGNNVKIIELNRKRCKELSNYLPGATIINGDGASQELLLEEGLRSMDAFVALTGMDEENILISIFASSQNVPKVIAKVNREELAAMAERLGLESIVSPKNTTVNVVSRYARALENSAGSNMETLYRLMDGKAEAIEFIVKDSFKYKAIPLRDLITENNSLIAGIIRGRRSIIPTGEDVILPGDKVIVLAAGLRISDLTDIVKGQRIQE